MTRQASAKAHGVARAICRNILTPACLTAVHELGRLPRLHPYAIAVADGIVWYNESGQRPDTLVRFDPKTETFQSWAIPSGDVHAGIVRHMCATRDGNLVLHQSSTNRIILMTPARKVASR